MIRAARFIFFFFILVLFSCSKEETSILSFEAMNTFCTIKSSGKNAALVNQKARSCMQEIESFLSVTKEESDIYRINNAEVFPVKVSSITSEVVSYALSVSAKTEGSLNPALYPVTRLWGFTTGTLHVPSYEETSSALAFCDYKKVSVEKDCVFMEKGMALDLGAVGKGFAGDRILSLYKENGINSAVIDLGGNVQVLGSKPDGSAWSVGLRNPFGTGTVSLSVKVTDKAVITSGGSERFFYADGKKYIHIFDPKTGWPCSNGLASVTIVCPSGLYADSLSTALFVMGKEAAADFWKSNPDFDFIIITDDFSVYYSEGLSSSIDFYDAFTSINEVVLK